VPFLFAVTRLPVVAADVALLYPNGAEAARYEVPRASAAENAETLVPSLLVAPPLPAKPATRISPAQPVFRENPPSVEAAAIPAFLVETTTPAAVAEVASRGEFGTAPWFAAAVALVVVSAGGYLFASRTAPKETSKAEKLSEEAGEYDIVE
jgi:hypothetical protein